MNCHFKDHILFGYMYVNNSLRKTCIIEYLACLQVFHIISYEELSSILDMILFLCYKFE